MGNCQAIDAATLVIQHPSGKVENLYCPVPATHIMKLNPGHYVALLITTTISATKTTTSARSSVRITRVKVLRPTETLALGHVYRLITTQEVMKGLVAKKQAKMRKSEIKLADSEASVEKLLTKSLQDAQSHQVSRQGHRHRAKPTQRTWQPSLHSISEAGSGNGR